MSRHKLLAYLLALALLPGVMGGGPAAVLGQAEHQAAILVFTQEFDVLNPLYTNMFFSLITHQIWNAWAWDFDETNTPHPVLVTEIPSRENGGISEDGRTITLRLRDDLVWSDGAPLTSADFLFTYQMAIDPNNAVASSYPYDRIESISAPDARTVVITFPEPFAPWLATMWKGILPEHILRPVYEAEGTLDNAAWNRFPSVGCGPYVLSEWETGSFARFVVNENYWLDRPLIDEIVTLFVPDDASQVAALQAGDGDVGAFIAYADIPPLQAAGVRVIAVASGYNEGWFFYLDPAQGHPALQDVRVRQAIALALDRDALVRDLLLGLTEPPATFWHNTPWADPSIQPWPYDPDRARALLDEAGWIDSNGDGIREKDGVDLMLTYGTSIRQVRQDTQAVAQQQLAQVGIGLDLLQFSGDVLFAGYNEGGPAATGQLDIYEYSETPNFPDPDAAYWLCSEIPTTESPNGLNWQALCDEELDALFRLQATQADFAERQQTFFQIGQIMHDRMYWLGLWYDPDIWAVGPRLENVLIGGVTPFFNIREWVLNPS